MFSMKRRWFMAYWTGLLKARGRRKGQNRFWPVAAVERQKLAGCAYVRCVCMCAPALHLCVCSRAVSPTPSPFLTWCNHSKGVCSGCCSHAAASKC